MTRYDDMTLDEATRLRAHPGWACACVGPPIPSPLGTPCWCQLAYLQADRLHRAAHIVVKLLAARGGTGTDQDR